MTWMSTRMSTLQLNYFLKDKVSNATLDLQIASQELTTGRRADMFGDLGPRVANSLTMRMQETNTQSYIVSNELLQNKLQATLDSVEVMRQEAGDVLEGVILNKNSIPSGVLVLQEEARAALEVVLGNLNLSFNGEYVFSGTSSTNKTVTRWDEVNPETGLSPEAVMQSIVTGAPTSAADAQAMIDDLDAIFSSTYAADPDANFEATFFGGTPLQDSSGNDNERISARLDVGQVLEYGVQGNDKPFRDIIQGLAMLSVLDLQDFTDEAAYSTWMEAISEKLGTGNQGALEVSADIGFNQQVVDRAQLRLEDKSLVQTTQIATYENVDPYEAATRMTALQTQLQASYSVTARLAELTIMNYIR